ncbi:MAG: lasso peptide biosynthesis B2 protein, partial [Chloroflexi bacterium]|nr:lasso peptide biosynthesis B2 protein [Chloroflexota bacterium]
LNPDTHAQDTPRPPSQITARWIIGLIGAWVLLRLVDVGLRVSGYRAVCRVLLATSPQPDDQRRDDDRARAYGRLVNRAGRSFSRSICLRRSLVTWWLLRWNRLPAVIHIAVRPNDSLVSHSWVEHHGVVVNDVPHVAQIYPLSFTDMVDPARVVTLPRTGTH